MAILTATIHIAFIWRQYPLPWVPMATTTGAIGDGVHQWRHWMALQFDRYRHHLLSSLAPMASCPILSDTFAKMTKPYQSKPSFFGCLGCEVCII
jgi:hypothetical protein